MAKLPEWLEEQLRRQEEERKRTMLKYYAPIKPEAPPLIPPVKRHSSNPIAGLGRADVERILRQEGWKPTISAPRYVIDYQKAGNRILLYPDEADKITMKQLRYLMDTPIERRTFVWWQIEGSSSSNPDDRRIIPTRMTSLLDFRIKWGTKGASLLLNKAVEDIILSEPMQDSLLELSKDLRELLGG